MYMYITELRHNLMITYDDVIGLYWYLFIEYLVGHVPQRTARGRRSSEDTSRGLSGRNYVYPPEPRKYPYSSRSISQRSQHRVQFRVPRSHPFSDYGPFGRSVTYVSYY